MVKQTLACVVDDRSDGGADATIAGCVGDVCVRAVPERYGQMLGQLIGTD